MAMLAHLGYRAKVEVYESNWKRSAAAPVFRLCQSSVLRTQSSLPAVSCQPGQGSISVCGLWAVVCGQPVDRPGGFLAPNALQSICQ